MPSFKGLRLKAVWPIIAAIVFAVAAHFAES